MVHWIVAASEPGCTEIPLITGGVESEPSARNTAWIVVSPERVTTVGFWPVTMSPVQPSKTKPGSGMAVSSTFAPTA